MSNKLIRVAIVIVFLLTLCVFVPKGAFASTFHLSPGSGTVGVGGTLAVRVSLNTGGEGVNGVSAYLSYPPDTLDVTYVTGSGTFAIEAEKSFGGGSIRISRGNINPVSGNVTVATIAFRGKSLGSATVSFVGGSAAPRATDSSDSLNLGGSSGGVYTVVQGQAQGPSQPGQPTPLEPAKDTFGPIISDVTVSNVATNSATITWRTDEETDSTVEYGLAEGQYFLSTSTSKLSTEHSITLDNPILVPGVKIHFRVIGKDVDNNITYGDDMAFHLKGYQVTLTLIDTNQKPIQQTEVLLYSDEPQRSTTNSTGKVVFADVTAGKHLVVVKLKDKLSQTHEITIADTPMEQAFTVTVERPILFNPMYILATVGATIISLLGIIGAVRFIRR